VLLQLSGRTLCYPQMVCGTLSLSFPLRFKNVDVDPQLPTCYSRVCVDRSVFSYTIHQPKSAGRMAKGQRIWLALPTFTASAY
jgi:hypothetical protein